MGNLVDSLRKKRDESQSGKFFNVIPARPLWKPPMDGQKAYVRILPATKEMEYYYWEYYAHFQLGPNKKEAHLCGRRFHDTCPICDVVNELYEAERKDEARDYKAKQKFLVNMLARDDMKSPAKFYIGMIGSSIEQSITAYILGKDEEGDDEEEVISIKPLGDVTHYKTGYWFLIKTRPKGPDRTPNNYYKVAPLSKPTPIAPDIEVIKKVLKQRANLGELVESAVTPLDQMEKVAEQLRRLLFRSASPKAAGKKRRRPVEEEQDFEEADTEDLEF